MCGIGCHKSTRPDTLLPHKQLTHVVDLSGKLLDKEHIDRICSSDAPSEIERLDLSDALVTDDTLTELLTACDLSNVVGLDLSRNMLTGAGVDALMSHQGLPKLRELDLSYNRLEDATITRQSSLGALERLSLHETQLRPAGYTSLARAGVFDNLTHLDSSGTWLDVDAIAVMLDGRHLEQLEAWILRGVYFEGDSMRALLASEHLGSLNTLELSSSWVTAAEVNALIDGPLLTNIHTLTLGSCELLVDELGALFHSEKFARVRRLELGCYLDDKLVRALIDSPHTKQIQALNLSFTRGTTLFYEHKWPALKRLEVTELTPIQVDAIAKHNPFDQLEALEFKYFDNGYIDGEQPRTPPNFPIVGFLPSLRILRTGEHIHCTDELDLWLQSGQLTNLEVLDIACTPSAEAFMRFAEIEDGAQLRTLHLLTKHIDDEAMLTLIENGRLRQLESLRLSTGRLTARAIIPLFDQLERASLKYVRLTALPLDAYKDASVLYTSPRWENVEELWLDAADFNSDQARAIANNHDFSKLERLTLSGEKIDQLALTHLSSSLSLELSSFTLGLTTATDEQLATYLSTDVFAHLREAKFLHNKAGRHTVRTLVEGDMARGLRVIEFVSIFVGDDATESLARSKTLHNLEELTLFEAGITKHSIKLLTKADFLDTLQWISLHGNNVSTSLWPTPQRPKLSDKKPNVHRRHIDCTF